MTLANPNSVILKNKFDIDDMGHAHWYLQGRLIQNNDFSIQLDQSHYMSHIAARFLPEYNNINISKEEKEKYQSPLPTTFAPTKQDCSNNALEVQALEEIIMGIKYLTCNQFHMQKRSD